MSEIVDYIDLVRRGWWCSECGAWEDAIGRERVVVVGTDNKKPLW